MQMTGGTIGDVPQEGEEAVIGDDGRDCDKEGDKYIYEEEETPEQHQKSLEQFYQDRKKYRGTLASIHDGDPEYEEYYKNRAHSESLLKHPQLTRAKDTMSSIGKKIQDTAEKYNLKDLASNAGKKYYEHDTAGKNLFAKTMYEGGKTVYDNGKPLAAKAASNYNKKKEKNSKSGGTRSRRTTNKKKRGGSSGGF